jgi:hypothetical protein
MLHAIDQGAIAMREAKSGAGGHHRDLPMSSMGSS